MIKNEIFKIQRLPKYLYRERPESLQETKIFEIGPLSVENFAFKLAYVALVSLR